MGQGEYKCLIVDDDTDAHLTIEAHLSRHGNLKINGNAYDGRSAIEMLISDDFDILFLDIEMPLLSGLELLQVLAVRPATIITSAFTDYAFEAYQNNVVDYIQKPILQHRFEQAFAKARIYIEHLPKPTIETQIEIKSDRNFMTVNIKDIIYVKSLGNYLKVFMKQMPNPLICYGSLRDMNDQLVPHGFVQVHRSFLVNKYAINRKQTLEIELKNGTKIPVGNKYDYLVDRFLQTD
jgi:DNA-binding LytR/AlgR family response regulator